MLGGSTEGAESEGGVEAGFAHGAIAFVEGAGEPVSANVRVGADDGVGGVATEGGEAGALGRAGMAASVDEIARIVVGMGEEPADDVGVVGAVVGHFGDGTVAEIEVAGEASVSSAMHGQEPDGVVALGVDVGAGEPCEGLLPVAGSDFGFVDGANHG